MDLDTVEEYLNVSHETIKKLFNEHVCTYCGRPSNNRDHVVPRSFSDYNPDNTPTTKKNTVPSCSQCNGVLGSRPILNIGDRAQFLIEMYTKKFKDLLAMPHHSDDDINELEGTLKKMMKNSMKQKKIVLDRMEHLDLITLLKPTIKDVQDIIKTNK
tara:strand:+ start:416 stop:886 length:471 start_codon:yes stop_codon:yes gene_type:complete